MFKALALSVAGFFHRGYKDEHGGMLVFVAALTIPLMLVIGMAIDGARGYLLRARLGDAIDAAGLAATMSFSDTDHFEEDFEQVFYANLPDDFLDAEVTLDTPVVSDDKMTITYSASATIETTFMRVAGIDSLTVANMAEVTRQTASLDLVISLDMSYSMNSNDRIDGAREAASTLVDILYGEDSTKDYLNIGFVPWNSKVNVTDGSAYTSSTTQAVSGFTNPVTGTYQTEVYIANNSVVPLLSQPPANWQGCVYARYSDDSNDNNDADLLLGPISVGGADWQAWQPIGPNDEPTPQGTCNDSLGSSGCGPCLDHAITRLTNDKTTVDSAIDALTTPDGHTNIVQGLAWAYRALSPGTPFDDAEEDPVGNHQRAIVLLTDGEQHGNRADAYDGAFGSGDSAGENGLDQRLVDLATYIKSQGIAIYAIQYYHNDGPLATLMKQVATETGSPYYHFAPDSDALDDVFEEIANHLSNLRLSM